MESLKATTEEHESLARRLEDAEARLEELRRGKEKVPLPINLWKSSILQRDRAANVCTLAANDDADANAKNVGSTQNCAKAEEPVIWTNTPFVRWIGSAEAEEFIHTLTSVGI